MTVQSGTESSTRPAGADPVAIVGMACRLPGGADTPEALWELLVSGTDATGPLPTDRGWDLDALAGPGGSSAQRGGFLTGATEFDAGFFGITAREALAVDPQQRLLLEVAWEAIERAGVDPLSLRGGRTGVFVGVSGEDYALLADRAEEDLAGYAVTGTTPGVASGRLAYVLGLRGPALTLDTASSSSLTALHCAVRALRAGECSLALAGGAAVMSTPRSLVGYSRQGGLSPDGRCKPFSADADGTAWGEGAGVLLLERLSDAWRHGHRVLAVVRGSAVNSDGATEGLTAPSGEAQREVIGQALADAGLTPEQIDAVEAHGTGTRVGDPVEAGALLAAYGAHRPAGRPLWIGSLKSNLGHAQAAAGVAGVLKTVLALRHGVLPPTLHVGTPAPAVAESGGRLAVPVETTPWPQTGEPRRAGVSSFGIGGTNVHLVLEQAPSEPPATRPAGAPDTALTDPVPWVVSARSEAALDAGLDRIRALPADDARQRADIGWTLAVGRAALPHRALLLAGADAVREVARGVAQDRPVALVFSGQGSQRVGMGRELYARFPVFAEALEELLAAFDAHTDEPLREALWGRDAALLSRTGCAQPLLFAFQLALYRLLESLGVTPSHLAGHSLGEVAAAQVAGVFPVADACRLVAARAALMQALPTPGAMVAVRAPEAELLPRLPGGVAVAAVNGPAQLVLSGAADALLPLAAELAAEGLTTTRLPVSHAFHSPLMDPVLADFRTVVAELTLRPPRIPVVSNVTGALAEPGLLTSPDYWVRHVRETVRFADGVAALADAGAGTLLELGPDGSLTSLTTDLLAGTGARAVAAQRKDRPEHRALLTALGQLHTAGTPVDWPALFAGTGARRTELPTTAFQRTRHWPTVRTTGPPAADPYAAPAEATAPEAAGQPEGATLPAAPADDAAAAALAEIRALTGTRRTRALLDLVRSQAAAVVGEPSVERADASLAFRELGFDSLTETELRTRLAAATGLPLPGTLLFDRPTPADLADWLDRHLAPAGSGGRPPLLAGLDDWERDLRALPDGDAERDKALSRLQDLLAQLRPDTHGPRRPAADRGPGSGDEDIDATPVDRLLDLIDEEFELR